MRSISVISLAVLVWYSIAIRRSWFQNSGSTPSCQIVLRAFPDNDPHPAVQRCAHLRLMITLGPEDRGVLLKSARPSKGNMQQDSGASPYLIGNK